MTFGERLAAKMRIADKAFDHYRVRPAGHDRWYLLAIVFLTIWVNAGLNTAKGSPVISGSGVIGPGGLRLWHFNQARI
jgi:hypothetical protein